MAKLYIISPPKIDLPVFSESLKSAISGGEVAAFQLRLKNISADDITRAAETLMPICHDAQIAFIINDSVEITKKTGASGVHLGSDDGNIKQARSILGSDFIIGASCYNSIDMAINAATDGADYVSFGAFYETTTKTPKAKAELVTLEKWSNAANILCAAIGGITPQNAEPIAEAGADFICSVSYIWHHPISPAKAVQEFNQVIL